MRGRRIDAAVALRARMIGILAWDPCVSSCAKRLDVDRSSVRMWRDRYLANGVAGIVDYLRWEARIPIYQPRFLAFSTHYGFRPRVLPPRKPEWKGKV
jgi:hypothetical protein